MLGFIKKAFFTGLTISFSLNLLSATTLIAVILSCILMTNQECEIRPEIVNVDSDQGGIKINASVNPKN